MEDCRKLWKMVRENGRLWNIMKLSQTATDWVRLCDTVGYCRRLWQTMETVGGCGEL